MPTKNNIEIEPNLSEFNKIINSKNLVVADFFAEWCMPCLMLAPVIESLAKKFKEVRFIKINIDSNQKLARNYQVSSIPCLITFKKGKEIDRLIGFHSAEDIEKKLKE